jgi:outer membrane protein OmpA-like peptidoglycan-associated protein
MEMIIKKLFVITALFLSAAALFSQEPEWAYKIVKYSSQLDKNVCSANQILGKPNVLPKGGESPFAWSVALDQNGDEKSGESSITVSFKNAIKVRQIAIAESFNPGSVNKIILISTKNKQYKVYEASPDTTCSSPRMLNIFIPLSDYEVKSLKLVTRPDKVNGMNQIDAVGISSSEDTIQAKINCIDESDFFAEPENLGQNINTPLNEIQPIISPDSKTLFFIRENAPDRFGVVNRNIMISTMNADNTWGFARNLGGVLSNKGENGYSVMHDGKSLLLGNVYNRDGSVSDGLSISYKDESGWTYPEKITIKNFYTSNPNSTFFMSNDNKILLLSLERKNGYGGLDIYVCFQKDKNTYSEPLNLGPEVNTVSDDCSPFLAADNMTLYYSTSGFSGFGSNDIFITRRLSSDWTKWTEPLNMGPKINTIDWDAYYTIPSSGEYAYFVSYKNSIGEGDIFRIELPRVAKPKPMINITGRITDSLSGNYLSAKLQPYMTSENRKLEEVSTGNNGEFKLSLPSTYKYEISITADGYIEHKEEIDLSKIGENYEISKDIYLIRKALKITPAAIAEKTKGVGTKSEKAVDSKPAISDDKIQEMKPEKNESEPQKSKSIAKKDKKAKEKLIAERTKSSNVSPTDTKLSDKAPDIKTKTDKIITEKPKSIVEEVKKTEPEPIADKNILDKNSDKKPGTKEKIAEKPKPIVEEVKKTEPEPIADKNLLDKNSDKKPETKEKIAEKPKSIAKKVTKTKQEPIAEKSDSPVTRPTSKNLNELFKYQPPKTDKNVITSIFFEKNNTELDENTRLLLDSTAQNVLLYPDGIVEIAGNADPSGSFSYNVKISIERARKVREYLISKNCNPKRLLLKGYSNLYPLYPNSSAESQAYNRRVDVILLKKKRFE